MLEHQFKAIKESLPTHEYRVKLSKKLLRGVIHLFAWIGMAILYYAVFSLFFDTPIEYDLKRSTAELQKQYEQLNQRYAQIENVLNNVIERDKSVFNTLFESDPYNLEDNFSEKRWLNYEKLLTKSNKELGDEFFAKLNNLDKKASAELFRLSTLEQTADSLGESLNYIPSIQPVINKDLTLLTASYGMRIHPFYKTLNSHQGVDYTVAEGSRIFATADGTVKDVITRRTTTGNSITISHGEGYETTYNHLSKVIARKGNKVKRGDIIAYSGNTGLSLAPHLHYEIKHNGMRIDPIHYFFMELNYNDYLKINKIARSGMQSFD